MFKMDLLNDVVVITKEIELLINKSLNHNNSNLHIY